MYSDLTTYFTSFESISKMLRKRVYRDYIYSTSPHSKIRYLYRKMDYKMIRTFFISTFDPISHYYMGSCHFLSS